MFCRIADAVEVKQADLEGHIRALTLEDIDLVKKLMGERKMVFFPNFHIFSLGPCCIWFPFSDSYIIEVHENDDFYAWLKCTFFCV
jgi:hypothetical protein